MEDAEMRRQLKDEGFCVFRNVLSIDQLERARAALDRGIEIERRIMGSTHNKLIDPNAANIRVNNLPAIDPVFIELLKQETALAAVNAILGPHFLVSNFTANIALPGSESMKIHSDQAFAVPPPWMNPWVMNIIWTLHDVFDANGATRYLPGSHRFQSFEDVPADAALHTRAFEAPAGSFIAMEGRLWHMSGRNITTAGQRRMMFAYYGNDFVRQQANWAFTLPPEVQAGMDGATRALFGLGPMGNARLGLPIVGLQPAIQGESKTS